MTYCEALDAVYDMNRQQVTRRGWMNRNCCLQIDPDSTRLCIKGGFNASTGQPDTDNLLHPYVLVEQDYFADDWEVVE